MDFLQELLMLVGAAQCPMGDAGARTMTQVALRHHLLLHYCILITSLPFSLSPLGFLIPLAL